MLYSPALENGNCLGDIFSIYCDKTGRDDITRNSEVLMFLNRSTMTCKHKMTINTVKKILDVANH